MKIDKHKFERSSFGLGNFNTQTMQALHKKYYRDYLPFFQELSKLYKQGKNKNEIVETINLIKKIQTLLGDIIKEGSIEKDDADLLYSSVKKIEEKKLYFLEEVANVKALQEKIQKVEATTGISLEDLNVTKEVVEHGIRESRKKSEHPGSFLKRTAPTMHGMAVSGGQAVAASMLGPFYGAVKGAYGLGKDVLNIGKGLREKRQTNLGSSLRSDIRTSGSRVISPGVTPESTQVARTRPPKVDSFTGFSSSPSQREENRISQDNDWSGVFQNRESHLKRDNDWSGVFQNQKESHPQKTELNKPNLEQQVAPLQEFFDKGAYKAKWTKELLSTSKEKKEGSKESMGFLGDFKAGIIPFIGKAGQFALLGAAIAFTANRLYVLGGKVKEYLDVQGKVNIEIEKQRVLQEKQTERLNIALGENLRKAINSEDENARATAVSEIKSVEKERAGKQAAGTGYVKDWTSGAKSLLSGTKNRIENVFSRKVEPTTTSRGSVSKPTVQPPVVIPGMEDLNETLKRLNAQFDKGQYQGAASSKANPSVFDAADSMINDHASGRMTLGER